MDQEWSAKVDECLMANWYETKISKKTKTKTKQNKNKTKQNKTKKHFPKGIFQWSLD